MTAVIAPLLVPLLTALIALLLYRQPRLQQAVSIAGAAVLFISAVWLSNTVLENTITLAMGNWPPPYSITFIADRLSAIMVLISAGLGLAVLVYNVGFPADDKVSPMLHPLVHGMLAAVCGTVLTADLFNLYVWFELMLITVLGLLVVNSGLRNLEAAFKYFALNLLGTLLFLASVALLYGVAGQLSFAALAEAAQRPELASAVPVYVAMLCTAFLLKAAAFPMYFWLPASYHTLPLPMLALIGGLITKVGIYVLLRITGEVFVAQPSIFYEALGWLAVVTMVSGVLGAAYHWDLRRILAFHIVSQIGYLMLAVALATPQSGAAGVFFMVHNILAKATLFLIAGIMWRRAGHYDLRKIGGLYPASPVLGMCFIIAGFSLVGVPPSSGFWGKFMLVQESFAGEHFVWGGFALAVGVLTLYSMVKIWIEGFWKPHPSGQVVTSASPAMALDSSVVILLVALLVVIGVYPEPLIEYANTATASFWTQGAR